MISYIRGTLAEVSPDLIVVEAGSIGFDIRVPLSVTESLPPVGSEVRIYTYLKVSDDALTLYGFNSRQDLQMFRRLINVSGVGPKGALSVLSALSPDRLRLAVLGGDARAISKAPGIGLKTAQKIILDLKDQIRPEDLSEIPGRESEPVPMEAEGAAQEAVEALTQLGYSLSEAGRAVRAVRGAEAMDSAAILKAALRQFRL